MRAVAISVWLFINLVFLGMCGYMYLLWRQYWLHAERQRLRLSVPTAPAYPYDVQYLDLVVQHGGGAKVADKESRSSRRHLANHSSPQVKPIGSKCRPSVERCEGEEDPLQSRRLTPSVVAHKSQLVVQMRRVLLDEASFFAHDRNVYDVHYKGLKGSYNKIPPKDLVCALKKYVRIRTLTPSDEPFASLGIGQEFPSKPLYAKQSTNKRHQFASCAIVASAGSLSDSRLGNFIDSHEAVVRFNHAPTYGFEADVGKKTTLRIVNSQVVSKPEFEFSTSPLYQNISLLAWDPCNYTSTLMKWYQHPDFDIFGPYFSRRKENPAEDLHLLDPRSAWAVWDFLQAHVPARLRRNPPSSGFLGLALMLPVCDHVDMIEFVPSLRLSKRCHYFDVAEDTGCTFGSWHPLAAEKLISLAMSSSDDNEIFGRGILRVKGYNALNC